MIEALVSGKLHGEPTEKIAKTGNPFVVAKVRAHAGENDVFINVIAFSPGACEALLALGSGDAVALAGTLTPKAWIDKEGIARPALDLVASQVLSAYHVTRKRKALEPRGHEQNHHPQASKPVRERDELDDGAPLDF
jgi:single-stranded DNA-binding protein